MTTLLYAHPAFLDHDPGDHHPECPARLRAIHAALDTAEFSLLERREAPEITLDVLELAHPAAHIDRIMGMIPPPGIGAGRAMIDADTLVSPGSGEAALRAAGAVVAAVDAVLDGEADNVFCAVRPPGHHAEAQRAMGFCLFNSIAVGALYAKQRRGVDRVAVIDFDVHHGNGTQDIFENDPDLLYVSTHQWPLYPGTGAPSERGQGNILNAVLPPHAGSEKFRDVVRTQVLPAVAAFGPGLIMISAGFDAHRDDPLANLELTDADYRWVTEELAALAAAHCQGRIVSALEGGYDLRALAASVAQHVSALMAAGAPA